jgi:hypothetical protein
MEDNEVMKRWMRPQSLIIVIIIIFASVIGLTFIDTLYRSKDDAGLMIAQEVVHLRDVFQKIHKDCGILDFDQQKNPINFLNVEKFAGSEVGPMNLIHSEKWQGPYVKENPTIYHIAYQVVSTDKGYFITPGDGVQLPNKKIVGKDIVLDKKADIEKMAQDPHALLYKEKALAARLNLGKENKVQFFLEEE